MILLADMWKAKKKNVEIYALSERPNTSDSIPHGRDNY
jgi:hypothetical protein